MPEWPDQPTAGCSVRLPLALPAMLLDALDYQGGARYVALRWSGGGGGTCATATAPPTRPGWWLAWRLLTGEHRLGRVIFDPYDLGDASEDPAVEAPHRLLCDRLEQTMWIGLAHDVQMLLRSQPCELHALARELGPERVAAAMRQQLEKRPMPTPAQITDQMRRKQALLAQLRAWLDGLLDELQ